MSTTTGSTNIPVLTTATFDEAIGAAELPVLVDVWAQWCPPCKALEPVLASIAAEHRDDLQMFKLDGDENPEIMSRFGVMSLPTMLVFKDGELVKRLVGAKGRGHLLQELADVLS
jgi:thioredoxin 1